MLRTTTTRRSPNQSSDDGELAREVFDTPLWPLITSTIQNAWRSPKVKVGLLLWSIGLIFMVFAPALTSLTPEMKDNYDQMITEAANFNEYQDALTSLAIAQADVYDAQVWFWRFRSPHSDIVAEKQANLAIVQAKVDAIEAVRAEGLRKANQYVGLWSEYGMNEVRERFWSAFEAGKVFAKRQTFFQMFYSLFNTKENVIGIILQWVMIALINFTMGLIGSLFYFSYSLGVMIFSYSPNPVTGVLFYVLGLLGAISLVATYLFAIYGMAASGVYVFGKLAVRNMAIQYERQRAEEEERRRLRGGRQHDHDQ